MLDGFSDRLLPLPQLIFMEASVNPVPPSDKFLVVRFPDHGHELPYDLSRIPSSPHRDLLRPERLHVLCDCPAWPTEPCLVSRKMLSNPGYSRMRSSRRYHAVERMPTQLSEFRESGPPNAQTACDRFRTSETRAGRPPHARLTGVSSIARFPILRRAYTSPPQSLLRPLLSILRSGDEGSSRLRSYVPGARP
jgi:hypothetical protein